MRSLPLIPGPSPPKRGRGEEEYGVALTLLRGLKPGEPANARDWFVWAMAEKKLGNDRAVRASLAEGLRVLEVGRAKPRDGDVAFDAAGGWLSRAMEDLFRQEAEELLNGK